MFYKQMRKGNNNPIIWAYKEFIKKYQVYFMLYVCLKTISGIIGFVPPIFIGKVIDYAVDKNGEKVIIILIMLILVLLLNAFISIFESKVEIKINYLVTNGIKEKIIKKFAYMEQSDIETMDRGEFISRLEDAEEIVRIFIEITSLLFIDLLSFIFALVVMLSISPMLSLICFLNIPMVVIVQDKLGKKIGKKEKDIKIINDSYYSFLYEIIDANKEIKIWGLQEEICKKYAEKLIQNTRLAKDKSDISIMAGFLSVMINGFFQLAVLASGCYFIMLGRVSVGNYFTFNSYVSRFNMELQNISQFYMKKQMYLVSINRLQELFHMRSETERISIGTYKECDNSDFIRLKNVFFCYQENTKAILQIKNFVFHKNEISAILGENGAGKSTLFDLITYFYLYKGEIYIGNINIKALSLQQIRKEICYIQQNPYFFKKSILENLRLKDKGISLKEVEEACKKVGMHEFIQGLPDKYETIVSEEGTNFSGGQLQRMALARAILSKSSIILLDEVTSGIDSKGRHILYNIISDLKKNRIILIITHDADISKIADRMVYLADGELSEVIKSKGDQ